MEEQVVTPPDGAEVVPPSTEQVAEAVPEVKPDEPVVKETPEETAKKKTAQERINEITRLRREAEREAEYWRAKALQTEQPKPAPKPAADGRPKVADFGTVEEYEDALLNWHEGRRTREMTLAEKNKRKQEAVQQFEEKANTLRVEHEDYDEVISRPVFTDAMKDVLLSSENGPGLAYYIASHKDIANRIARMPAELQSYELGKLETEYLIAKKTKKVTSAPEPIKPIGATGGPSSIDESKLDDNEWFKLEQKRRLDKLKSKGG